MVHTFTQDAEAGGYLEFQAILVYWVSSRTAKDTDPGLESVLSIAHIPHLPQYWRVNPALMLAEKALGCIPSLLFHVFLRLALNFCFCFGLLLGLQVP